MFNFSILGGDTSIPAFSYFNFIADIKNSKSTTVNWKTAKTGVDYELPLILF